MGSGFTWETLAIVLLDEMIYMVKYGYIDLAEIIEALHNRPKRQVVLITGRACHRRLIELADTGSAVQPIKHAFKVGVKAQQALDG